MSAEVKILRIVPECVEYADYLSKEMGLTPEEVSRVAEVCSNSGIRRWRGAVAYAAAYLLRYGPRASGAALKAKTSYGYLWVFAPSGMTPSTFKTQVASTIVELQRIYPDLVGRLETEEDVVRWCSKLPVPGRVCRDAASVFAKLKGVASMTGKSKRGIAAGAVVYAASKAGVGIKVTEVAKVFMVSKDTVQARAEEIAEIME